MKRIHVVVALCVSFCATGCSTGSKFINPRSDLDRRIYYVESDSRQSTGDPAKRKNADDWHPISSRAYSETNQVVERVPQPAVVDINSNIQIIIAKQETTEQTSGAFSKETEGLVKTKEALTSALNSLQQIAAARLKMLEAYEKSGTNLEAFFEARQRSEQLEGGMLETLSALWREKDPATFREFDRAYAGDPSSETFRAFLRRQLSLVDAAHKRMELEAKARERTLTMEAFLLSPGKEPAPVHLEGYDSIAERSLRRNDPTGLDLSPEELSRLQRQAKSSEDLARTLEQLRKGEIALKDAVEKLAAQAVPEIDELIRAAEGLTKRVNAKALAARKAQTEQKFKAFVAVLETSSKELAKERKSALESDRDAIVERLLQETAASKLQEWLDSARKLRTGWQKATSSDMIALISQTQDLAKEFDGLWRNFPNVASDIEKRFNQFFDESRKGITEAERKVLRSKEATDLRADLQQYVQDAKDIAAVLTKATATLAALGTKPMSVLPQISAASLQVPQNRIKDTFINLERTPRVVGDEVLVRATLKDGDRVVDTSVASFRVGRYGHYADLSPAVVLVKPQQIAGTDDGYRFAPTLSWMYHWSPRPEQDSLGSGLARTLDPSIGIHSAFLNFNSPTSDSSAQIGLGVTVALWKNRLQFGWGYNLMANSEDEGRRYFFIGSDLIGLLQAVGIVKP